MTANTNTNTNNITVTINGVKFEGLTFEQAQTLGNMAHANAETKPAKPVRKAPKPAAKTAPKPAAKMTATTKKARNTAKQNAAKHAESLDSKRVARMVETATNRMKENGFTVDHVGKQGNWVWVYPAKDRQKCHEYVKAHAEYTAQKLAKGWKYSAKRAAYYRDFS